MSKKGCMSMIKEITSGKLPAVLKSPTPVVLEFGTSKCPDCQKSQSIVDHLSADYDDKVEVYYVDVDKVPEVQELYEVSDLPTMILFKEGKPQDKLVGPHSEQEINNFFRQE
ncbi:thioredoxin family protein [Desulfitobacterium sp. Sab5]|uniref:thioredoxin family protein n=1 Tax=Desulfitobacterium nosdiversum TaxID=3375356 RepID=UPI003CF0B8EA